MIVKWRDAGGWQGSTAGAGGRAPGRAACGAPPPADTRALAVTGSARAPRRRCAGGGRVLPVLVLPEGPAPCSPDAIDVGDLG